MRNTTFGCSPRSFRNIKSHFYPVRAYLFCGKGATDGANTGFSEFIRFSWTPLLAPRSTVLWRGSVTTVVVVLVLVHVHASASALVLLLLLY